jgi:hypothetical protein
MGIAGFFEGFDTARICAADFLLPGRVGLRYI